LPLLRPQGIKRVRQVDQTPLGADRGNHRLCGESLFDLLREEESDDLATFSAPDLFADDYLEGGTLLEFESARNFVVVRYGQHINTFVEAAPDDGTCRHRAVGRRVGVRVEYGL